MAERQDKRVRDHNDPEPWLTISRRDAGRAVAASAMLAGFFRLSPSEGQDVAQAGGVGFAARVIELQSGKPLEGVVVHVEQSVRGADPAALPLWAGESTIRTDAEGRFRLDFTPEQVAEPAMCIALRIRHPGFIHRKCYKVLLAELVRAQARGEEPFFSTIKLEKGIEYTGLVVIPGGKPAVGVPYCFENWPFGTNRSESFHDDTEGETDRDGQICLRLGKSLGSPSTWVRRTQCGHASRMRLINIIGGRLVLPNTRTSGPRPTLAGSCSLAGFGCRAGWWIPKAGRSRDRTSGLSR